MKIIVCYLTIQQVVINTENLYNFEALIVCVKRLFFNVVISIKNKLLKWKK
jgi:hypothetical protein